MNAITQQQLLIPEEKYITPIVEILNSTNDPESQNKATPTKKSLEALFPEQEYEEKAIKKTKEILGIKASQFAPEQLRDVVAEVQYLAMSWLDDFERGIFEGKTLMELLHEKGGL